jgi:transposase
MAKRKRHTEEFKREAVAMVESRGSRSIEGVATGIGVATGLLFKWRKQYGSDVRRSQDGETLEQENTRLRRENAGLKRDREVLKKSIAFFVNDRN